MSGDAVAIIGLACRFPGAPDAARFWSNLQDGVESIRFFEDEELLAAGVPPSDLADPSYVKASPVLADAEAFDAGFFGYSPREARLMDPQQRIFLEVAWSALEDAGLAPDGHGGVTGCFAGTGGVVTSWLVAHQEEHPELVGATGSLAHLGNDKDFVATRASYRMDLRGPSINVQTACSTSIVALHLACRSVLDGESDLALAGASTVRFPQIAGYRMEKGDILSPDGHCRAFDARAQGTIFGSGAGVVVLKRLDAAVADGDAIYAVVRATALNNDGGEKVSFTASSVPGQVRAIVEAMALADVAPDTVGYVECHGTGTAVGDPLEVQALTRAFRAGTKKRRFCAIGSVKTNVGHLEQAAGMAGLIKTVLAIHHGRLPPSLNFDTPNPRIDFRRSPFFVNTELRDWPLDGARRAGLNSLGLGGTNAFAVLEQAPAEVTRPDAEPELGLHLLALDAPVEEGLDALAHAHLTRLGDAPRLGDYARTTLTGRSRSRKRLTVRGRDRTELLEGLRAAARGEAHPAVRRSAVTHRGAREAAFLFTGQGAQRPGMGAGLYAASSVFRAEVDRCDAAMREGLGRSVRDVLFAPAGTAEADLLSRTEWTQPALFTLQVGLAALWRSWGVVPDVVLGHSVGAFAAAVVAGALPLEAAAGLIAARGAAMGALPGGGAMATVFAGPAAVRAALEEAQGAVEIAVVNAPQAVVVAGDEAAVVRVCGRLEAQGVPSRRLEVSHAFHSHRMEPALPAIRRAAEGIEASAPRIPWISDSTGLIVGAAPDGDLWVDHARGSVQFAAALGTLAERRPGALVEIGPATTLLGLARRVAPDLDAAPIPSLDPRLPDPDAAMAALQAWHGEGRAVDWDGLYSPRGRAARLPTYPFQRTMYALGAPRSASRGGVDTGHRLLGRRLRSGLPDVQYESRFSLDELGFLDDHRMYGMAVLPTTVGLEIARAAAALHFGTDRVAVEDLGHEEALVLPEEGARIVQTIVSPQAGGRAGFRLLSTAEAEEEDWRVHMRATLVRDETPLPESSFAAPEGAVDSGAFYAALRRHGLEYGPRFAGITALDATDSEIRCTVELPAGGYRLHPATMDACLHAYAALAEPHADGWSPEPPAWLPIGVGRWRVLGEQPPKVLARVSLSARDADTARVDVEVRAPDGAPVAELRGLALRRLPAEVLRPKARDDVGDWLVRVRWDEAPAAPTPEAADPGRWLILGDDDGVGGALREQLVSVGGAVTLWPAPEVGRSVAKESLAGWAGAGGPPCRGVVWVLDDADSAPSASWGWTLVALITALAELRAATGTGLRVHVVTRAVWAAGEGDRPRPGRGAAVWGVGRAAALEVPAMWGGLIDLAEHADPVDAVAGADAEARAVCAELFADDREDQVALRWGRRLVARLERLPADVPRRPEPVVRPDATYLVTGGLGFLGMLVVRRLVERGARAIAITSRSGRTERVSAELAALAAEGARVEVIAADVVDEADVARVLSTVSSTMPPLRGVFHCAGTLDDGVITGLSREQFERVTAPKIVAGLHLDRLTAGLALDHFVLFSSILSLIGSAGQANYTAGNAVLDSLAAARRARGETASAINWGPWAEAGLATESGARGEAIWRSRGTRYIPEDGGLDVFDRLLDRDVEHCGVTATDWGVFLEQWDPAPRLYDVLAEEVGPRRSGGAGRAIADIKARLDAAPPAERRPLIVELVRLQIMQTLEIEELIDLDRPISEFGLDSLMSVSLVNRLETLLGVAVPVVKLIQGPTIVELIADLFPDLPAGDAPGVAEAPPPETEAETERAPSNPWLVTLGRRPSPRLRLFCFPFAGGGSAVFRSWAEHLSPSIEVVAVEPPGRLHRIRERPIRTLKGFLDGLVPAMEGRLDRPYACFGHCLGGLTMFETVRELRRRGAPMPVALFASGSRPPDRVNRKGPFEERLGRMLSRRPQFNPFLNPYEQPDDVFAEVIRQFDIEVSESLLQSAELRALMLPAVRAEFEMTARYRYRDQPPFTFPITCFSGKDDLYVSRGDSMRWGRFTTGDFRLFTRAGAHFLMVEDRSFLVSTIEAELQETLR